MKMQIKQEEQEIDIFVGTKIGSFKHVKYHTDVTKNTKKCIENLVDIKSLQKDEGITCMEWGNKEQTEILIGKKNQEIQAFTTDGTLTRSYTADYAAGDVVGLGRYHRRLVSAVSGGVVKIWSKKSEVLVNTGGKLDRMRVCAEDEVFATGGEENDLKVYRLGETEPSFVAKSLPHDWLQLRRPLWVSDLVFCPGTGGATVAVCSRYGYIRLYDTRAQRRPVCNIELEKMAATSMAPTADSRQVLVGFGRGQLHLTDFRVKRLDKGYKGCAGAVTGVAAAHGLVYSASLDRHLRVHCGKTKELLYKQYLTSKLSSILVQTEGSTPLRRIEEVKEVKEEVEGGVEVEEDLDQLFDAMDTIEEKPRKKKLPQEKTATSKKMKPSQDGSTIDLDESEVQENTEDNEDAIKKLLRSTEKQKRRMEKKKKEKKAKSVFHNA